MITKKTYHIIGWVVYILGIYLGHLLWYSADVKNGSGLSALFTVLVLSGIGLFMIFSIFSKHTLIPLILSLLGALGTFTIMWFYHDSKREQYIRENGDKTLGTIIFRDNVSRGKSSGQEIRYIYKVGEKTFEKYDTDQKYIIKQNLQIGDTLVIRYWRENPNYHSYKKIGDTQ